MLQNIRDKMQSQRWLTYTMLGALAIVFAAWGAYGMVDMSFGTSGFAAKVNGEKISSETANELWQQQQPRLLEAFGGNLTDAQREQFQQQVLDECVQLHGGYGYMNEYLVCRLFADSRVQRIYGGTNEIMKELISRAV